MQLSQELCKKAEEFGLFFGSLEVENYRDSHETMKFAPVWTANTLNIGRQSNLSDDEQIMFENLVEFTARKVWEEAISQDK